MEYLLALDQGTTGTTAALVDAKTLQFIGKVNHEYRQIYPQPSWVEHDLNDIWNSVESTVTELLKKFNVDARKITAIGITNQRETICAFDKKGNPVYHALVWQDKRTSAFCEEQTEASKEMVRRLTGLPLDPYFSATKIKWLLENSIEVQSAKSENDLCFGTIDTYLLYRLTAGESFKTEPSNASRTLLVNIESGDYDSALLSFFNVPRQTLPEIVDSFGEFGVTKGLSFLPDGIPITGILGDQQAALFGQNCLRTGELKCTYGTGAFLLVNTEDKIIRSSHGLLSTIAYGYKGKLAYALEGSSFIAGAAVQWLRDNLQLIGSAAESEAVAREVEDLKEMANILFLPFFSGIGSPYWIADAKAAIIGLTRDTKKSHLVRACLEGICFAIGDLVSAMEKDLGEKIKVLKVDGGAVANNLLMEMQSTISNLDVWRPEIIETTAYGAVLAAAVGKGNISLDELDAFHKLDKEFHVQEDEVAYYQQKREQWEKSIKRLY